MRKAHQPSAQHEHDNDDDQDQENQSAADEHDASSMNGWGISKFVSEQSATRVTAAANDTSLVCKADQAKVEAKNLGEKVKDKL